MLAIFEIVGALFAFSFGVGMVQGVIESFYKWSLSDDGIRWALEMPIIWRWAARTAETHDHIDSPACLPCIAKNRTKRNVHLPTLNTHRVYVCSKCGLDAHKWAGRPYCHGAKSRPQPTLPPQPKYNHYQTSW